MAGYFDFFRKIVGWKAAVEDTSIDMGQPNEVVTPLSMNRTIKPAAHTKVFKVQDITKVFKTEIIG